MKTILSCPLHYLGASLLLVLASVASGFSQAETLDQSNLGDVGQYSASAYTAIGGGNAAIGQSFTAGITGGLSKVVIDVSANGCTLISEFTFQASIVSGAGNGGAVLATQMVTVPLPLARQMAPIQFASPVSVTAGQVYTMYMVPLTSQVCESDMMGPMEAFIGWHASNPAPNNTYLAGTNYVGATAYDNDHFFQTFVSQPPLPSDISGKAKSERLGFSVAFAGDFNGDGFGDYVIGNPGEDLPPSITGDGAADTRKKVDAGVARVISGKDGAVLISLEGASSKDALGFSVAGGADIDNDGFDDVAVGAPGAGAGDEGNVTVLYGPDGVRKQTIAGSVAKSLFGAALALGDVNNDGNADIVIGAPKDKDLTNNLAEAGSVKVFNGTDLQLLQTFYGVTAKAHAGAAVATGNYSGDAAAEVIVGAPDDDDIRFPTSIIKDTGSVAVYNLAGTQLFTMPGMTSKVKFGQSVASGDTDNDGYDEVIAGSPGDDKVSIGLKDCGTVTVFSGNTGDLLSVYFGAVAKAGLGNSVAAADLDGDGFDEVIAGAWKDDAPSDPKALIDAGSVSVWSQSGYDMPFKSKVFGSASKDYFGTAVSAGDVNSDGKADLIIGISGKDIPGAKVIKDGGSVKVVSGTSL